MELPPSILQNQREAAFFIGQWSLLIQFPLRTFFTVFNFKAEGCKFITNLVRGSPVLIGFRHHALFQQHVYYFSESNFTFFIGIVFFLQSQNVETEEFLSGLSNLRQ